MKPVGLFVIEWRASKGLEVSSLSQDLSNELQSVLKAAGYVSFAVGEWTPEGIQADWQMIQRCFRWCCRHMPFDDYIRIGTRLYFNDVEKAMECRLSV